MVSTSEAMSIIREAKGVERSLGTSFYSTVTDTTTGQSKMRHEITIGMPAPNTGWGVSDSNALTTLIVGAIGAVSIFSSGRNFLLSQQGSSAKANKKQRTRALALLGIGTASFGLLSPGLVPYFGILGEDPFSAPTTTGAPKGGREGRNIG